MVPLPEKKSHNLTGENVSIILSLVFIIHCHMFPGESGVRLLTIFLMQYQTNLKAREKLLLQSDMGIRERKITRINLKLYTSSFFPFWSTSCCEMEDLRCQFWDL